MTFPDAQSEPGDAQNAIARADALLGQAHYLPDGLLADHTSEELIYSRNVIRAEREARTPLFYTPEETSKNP